LKPSTKRKPKSPLKLAKEKIDSLKQPSPKLPSIKSLHARVWAAWSKYRRSREADFSGYTECYTCRRKYPWKEMDLGHYHHGRLDFDEMNTHPQCVRCNKWLHGNAGPYAERLVQDYGLKKVLDLRRRAQIIHKYTMPELAALEEQFKNKLNAPAKK
jgi:hypothetical protein